MQLQSTYTPHLQRLSNVRPFGIQPNSTGELSQKFNEPRINGPKAVFGIAGRII